MVMLDILALFLVHSTSKTFLIDTIGFHQVSNVSKGDLIKVQFDSKSLRLFLFMPFNSYLAIDELIIDGENMSSQFHLFDEIGFAVDALQYAQFSFNSADKPKLRFQSDSISLWFIPRDLCSKSSYFESGGISSELSSHPSEQSKTSTSPYTQYSMCTFSPVFDYTKVEYSINFGVEANSDDVTSKSCLYTNNFDSSDMCVDKYNKDLKYKVSNAFFIQYTVEITNNKADYSINTDQISINLKRDTDKSNNTEFFDLFCIAQSVDACNSTTCVYDKEIENSFQYKCNTKLERYALMLLIVLASIAALIILIILLCICGCCACCGIAGCTFCICNIHHKKEMKQRLIEDDPDSIKTFSQNNNNYYTQDPATPLVYPKEQLSYPNYLDQGVPIVYPT